jgi:hypothetical protein
MTDVVGNPAVRLVAFLALLACISMVTGCKSEARQVVAPQVKASGATMTVFCAEDADRTHEYHADTLLYVDGDLIVGFADNTALTVSDDACLVVADQ